MCRTYSINTPACQQLQGSLVICPRPRESWTPLLSEQAKALETPLSVVLSACSADSQPLLKRGKHAL